jgi:hypothetical protein
MDLMAFSKLAGALLATSFLASALDSMGYPATARLLNLGGTLLLGWNLLQIGLKFYQAAMSLLGEFV